MTTKRLQIFSILGLFGTAFTLVMFVFLLRNFGPDIDPLEFRENLKTYCEIVFPLFLLMFYVFKGKQKKTTSNSELLDDLRVLKEPQVVELKSKNFYIGSAAYCFITTILLYLAALFFDLSSPTMLGILAMMFIICSLFWLFGGVIFVFFLVTKELL